MTQLELIGMQQLRNKLYEIAGRCNEKNQERMQHERIFILSDTKEALSICDAIIENNPQKTTR